MLGRLQATSEHPGSILAPASCWRRPRSSSEGLLARWLPPRQGSLQRPEEAASRWKHSVTCLEQKQVRLGVRKWWVRNDSQKQRLSNLNLQQSPRGLVKTVIASHSVCFSRSRVCQKKKKVAFLINSAVMLMLLARDLKFSDPLI